LDISLVLAVMSGIAISAACGLRAFLPLFLLGLADRMDWVALQPAASWLSSDHALWALGVATVVEIVADKIPVVDHALDSVGLVLRPAAGWLGAYAVLVQLPSPWAQVLAVVLGSASVAVQLVKAKLRIGSTAVTLGQANPVLSVAEDGLALTGWAIAILAPVAVLIVLFVIALWLSRHRRRAATVRPL
jgi:hypothetical protein